MKDKNSPLPNRQIVAQLQERLEQFSPPRRGSTQTVSSGCQELDRLLAHEGLRHGGLCRGTLVEWLGVSPGSGAGSLALAAAREACREGGPLVVIDRAACFYPPAAAQAGVELDRLIVVRPDNGADEVWALDQALRSSAVAAVLCWIERREPRMWRRMQLAAEAAGNLGLFVRPATARGDPSWAAVRFFVTPLPSSAVGRRLRIELLRLRGNPGGQTLDLELDDETGAVRLAPAVAAATLVRRAAGG
jgi:protein ImuA